MSTVPPINPAILAALQAATQSPVANVPLPPNVQLAAVIVQVLQSTNPTLTTVQNPVQLAGVVVAADPAQVQAQVQAQAQAQTSAQTAQLAKSDAQVIVNTARGQLVLALPESLENPLPNGTPVRLVITPQQALANGQIPPALVQLQAENTLLRRAVGNATPSPVLGKSGSIGGGRGLPVAPNLPLQALQEGGVLSPKPNTLTLGQPVQGRLLNTQAPITEISQSQTKPAGLLQNLLGGKPEATTQTTLPNTTPNTSKQILQMHLSSLPTLNTGELTKPPLGQIGLQIQIQSVVSDGTANGLVTAQTKTGTTPNLVGQRIQLQFPQGTVQAGQVVTVTTPDDSLPNVLPLLLTEGEELNKILQTALADTVAAKNAIAASMPSLNAGSTRFSAGVVLFMAMLRGGEAAAPLAQQLDMALKSAGRKDQADALKRLMSDIATRLPEDQNTQSNTPVSATVWRSMPLPLPMHDGVMGAWLHLHIPENPMQGKDGDKNDKRKNKSDRFVIDLSLTRMGQLQMDGLVRDKTVTVVLKSEQSFAQPVQQLLQDRFRQALDSADYAGTLRFQPRPPLHPDWTPWETGGGRPHFDPTLDHTDAYA